MAGKPSSSKTIEFTEFCDKHKIPYRTKGKHTRPGWVQIDCPYCGPGSGKFHLGFCLKYPLFNCWKCGKKPLGQTLSMVTGLRADALSKSINRFPRHEREQLEITGTLRTPKGVKPMQEMHRRYIRSRGFNDEVIEKVWSVQGIGIGYDLAYRLFIPIDYNNTICSWTTRSIADGDNIVRYISASAENERISHKKLLYGEDFAGNTIIIVEGPMDVWRIGPGAVGTFGTRPTKAQILRMSRYPKRYVCYDHGAERFSQMLIEELSAFPGETLLLTLDAEDPGSMSKKEVRQVRSLLD